MSGLVAGEMEGAGLVAAEMEGAGLAGATDAGGAVAELAVEPQAANASAITTLPKVRSRDFAIAVRTTISLSPDVRCPEDTLLDALLIRAVTVLEDIRSPFFEVGDLVFREQCNQPALPFWLIWERSSRRVTLH